MKFNELAHADDTSHFKQILQGNRRATSKPRVQKVLHKVGIITAGLTFGDDDILADRCYRGTLKCMSADGKVYCLPRD